MSHWRRIISLLFRKPNKTEHTLEFAEKKRHPVEHPWVRAVITFLLVTFLVWMLPSGPDMQFADMQVDSISPRRIVAPFSFEILKTSEEYQADCELAKREVKPVYIDQRSQLQEQMNKSNLKINLIQRLKKS